MERYAAIANSPTVRATGINEIAMAQIPKRLENMEITISQLTEKLGSVLQKAPTQVNVEARSINASSDLMESITKSLAKIEMLDKRLADLIALIDL